MIGVTSRIVNRYRGNRCRREGHLFAIRELIRGFAFPLIFLALFTGGCKQKEVYIPQEGDVVTWKHKPQLIIKARLGQRREHVVANPRTDHRFYEPQYERFIGQFPIDYEPEPFPKFTEEELAAFLAEDASKIPSPKSGHPLEFSLMLNGVKAKATDKSPVGGHGMDDSNQVKVVISSFSETVVTRSGVKRKAYNTQQGFELELMKRLDASSKETKYGLDCYRFKEGEGDRRKRCFGFSEHPSVSGFRLYVPQNTESNIYGESKSYIFGRIKVNWFTHQKNLKKAKDIDAAIWRLLEAWNISPIQNDHKANTM